MSKQILVVDDEKRIRKTTKKALEPEDYNVKTADSVPSARKVLKNSHIDVILLDIMLPGSLEQFVKHVDATYEVKILYLTSFPKSKAEKLGFLDLSKKIKGYIEKPFSLSSLYSKIENAWKEENIP